MMTTNPSSAETEDRLLRRDIDEETFINAKTIPISTKYGYVSVTQQGPPNRTAIVTYHDIGYNSATQFHHFFAFPEMMPVTKHFTIYHINAQGQEDQAHPLPSAATYPTIDQLAETLNDIFLQLNIKSAIGFGVGLGANVLARFALKYPPKIYGLILVNCVARGMRWLEGFSLKWPSKDIEEQRWTESLMNYLLWYHLGPETREAHPDLEQDLRRHLEGNIDVKNVIKLLNSFFKRSDLGIERPKNSGSSKTLKCTVLNITGVSSPHKADVIDTNERCDPATSSYIEFADCGGAILEEQPAKLAEAIRLFLQGLGYMSHISIPRYSTASRLAEQAAEFKRQNGSFSRVPRRLSTQISSGKDSREDSIEFEDELQLRVDSLVDRNTRI